MGKGQDHVIFVRPVHKAGAGIEISSHKITWGDANLNEMRHKKKKRGGWRENRQSY